MLRPVLKSIECCDGERRKADTSSVTGRMAAPVAGEVGWYEDDWAVKREDSEIWRLEDRAGFFGGEEVGGSV